MKRKVYSTTHSTSQYRMKIVSKRVTLSYQEDKQMKQQGVAKSEESRKWIAHDETTLQIWNEQNVSKAFRIKIANFRHTDQTEGDLIVGF